MAHWVEVRSYFCSCPACIIGTHGIAKMDLCKVVLYILCLYLYDHITASGLFLTQIGCDVGEVQVYLSAGILVQ